MGKQSVDDKSYTIKQLENQISKDQSFSKNITNFINKLRLRYPNISAKQYLIKVHNFVVNFKIQTKGKKQIGASVYKYSKICKVCNDWKSKQKLIECIQCEDCYHKKCAQNKIADEFQWICSTCEKTLIQLGNRQTKLDKDFGIEQKKNKKCAKCKKQILNDKQKSSCLKCTKHYHTSCFDLEINKIVCQECHLKIENQIKLRKSQVQTNLNSYIIKVEKEKLLFYGQKQSSKLEQNSTQDQNSITVSIAYPISLKPPIKLTTTQIQEYKKNLIYAIYSKRMEYIQENKYQDKKVLEDLEVLDLSIQRINEKDLKAFLEYKKQPIGPYEIYPVEKLGYDVRTKKNIPRGTIICQYVGEIFTRRQAIQYIHLSDSLMEVLSGTTADNSLIIIPFRYTNIARFINGINNSSKDSKNKANVQSIRFNIMGEPRVILFAKRFIKEGETLQYDYNAGGKGLFPTDDFI